MGSPLGRQRHPPGLHGSVSECVGLIVERSVFSAIPIGFRRRGCVGRCVGRGNDRVTQDHRPADRRRRPETDQPRGWATSRATSFASRQHRPDRRSNDETRVSKTGRSGERMICLHAFHQDRGRNVSEATARSPKCRQQHREPRLPTKNPPSRPIGHGPEDLIFRVISKSYETISFSQKSPFI
jgi:hypothetical protein